MLRVPRSLLAAAALVLAARGATAQAAATAGSASAMPESYRALQIRMLETERTMILHMIDSMPAQYFREKATPAQRDFGQQLHHAAVAFTMILPRFAGAPRPTVADTAAGFDKAGLRTYVNAVYDWAIGFARGQSAADREQTVAFFGGAQIPKWQIWDEMHQHTMWTLGQTVANFRMHGMPPAAFMFF